MSTGSRARLLLLGGGHSHLEVIRRLAFVPAGSRSVEATLVSSDRYTSYSGMLPGLVAGHYRFTETHVDLQRLCDRAGVTFVCSTATALRSEAREVVSADGASRRCDVLSIDTGASTDTGGVPGALEHAVAIRPVAPFLARWERLLRMQRADPARPLRVVVVGGGAGGVELALAMQFRLASALGASAARVVIVSESLLGSHARGVRRRVLAALREAGVEHQVGRAVRVTPNALHTSAGATCAADFIVFATGASAPTWYAESGLALDESGFIAVHRNLRSLSHPHVFAAGDVATEVGEPLPKSGVYAVRAGPVLSQNLREALAGRAPTAQVARSRYTLSLITSGRKHATLSYGPLALSGRWVWRYKERIDRAFVAKYAAGAQDATAHTSQRADKGEEECAKSPSE